MKTYKYCSLYYRSKDCIMVDCTDQTTLDWIIAEIKRLMPSCRLEEDKDLGTTFITKLQGKDATIGSRIRTQLCLRGWEPFAVTPRMEVGPVPLTYHFRFEEESF